MHLPPHTAFDIALEVQKISGPKLVEWRKVLTSDESFKGKLSQLRQEVESFAAQFIMPGHDLY